jgi:hypothetical protein
LGFGDPPTDGGGFAQLEVEGLASDLLIDAQQLQQTFSLSASAAKLSFEFSLTTSGTLAPSGTPDSFQVALLDSSGVPLLSTTGPFYSIDNDGTPFLDSGKVDVTDLAGGVRRVQLDVSGIPAQDVTIFFLLTADPFGRHDGLTTTVALDNVVLDSAAVPEPSSLAIMMVGVAIGGIAVGRSRRTGR